MQTALNQTPDLSAAPALLPLAVGQADVWRAQKLAPADALFNIGGYVDIRGAVDPQVFASALTRAIEDSDSLRIRIVDTADGRVQARTGVGRLEIPELDFIGADDSHAAALAWMRADM